MNCTITLLHFFSGLSKFNKLNRLIESKPCNTIMKLTNQELSLLIRHIRLFSVIFGGMNY